MKENLKILKTDIIIWKKEVFGDVETNIHKKKKEIDCLDRIDDAMCLDEIEIIQRNQSLAKLLRALIWQDKILCQKSKSHWFKDGDVNSSYFHRWINRRNKASEISDLSINDI